MKRFTVTGRLPVFFILSLLLGACASLSETDRQALGRLESDVDIVRGQIEARLSKTPESLLRDSLTVLDSILEYTAQVKADPARFKAADLRLYQQKIAIINENIERFSDLTLQADVSFPPGAHTLESLLGYGKEKNDQLVTKLTEVMHDLARKYPDQKIQVTIKTIGYTDETSVLPGTALEKEILAVLAQAPPTDAATKRQRFNEVLSRFRASTISDYVTEALRAAIPSDLGNIEIIPRIVGRGEALPLENEKYRRSDERRRICIVSPFIEVIP